MGKKGLTIKKEKTGQINSPHKCSMYQVDNFNQIYIFFPFFIHNDSAQSLSFNFWNVVNSTLFVPCLLILLPPARRLTLRLEWPFWTGTGISLPSSKPFNGSSTASRIKARFLIRPTGPIPSPCPAPPLPLRPPPSIPAFHVTYSFLMIHHLYTFELTHCLKCSPAPYPKPLTTSYFETDGSLLWAAFSGFFSS